MEGQAFNKGNGDVWKGVRFWMDALREAGLQEQLPQYNDVMTGKEAPKGYGEARFTDVELGGKLCDVYHTDWKPGDSYNRVYIHIKE